MKDVAPFFAIRSCAARITVALTLFAAVVLSLGTGSSASGADEVSDELLKLRASYDKDVEFSLRPIRDRYVLRLESLKRSLGSRGDARGAAAVQDELDRIRAAVGGAGAFSRFAGKWKVVYNHGAVRQYVINADGVLTGTDADGKTALPSVKLVVNGEDVLMNGNGGIVERFKISDKTLLIDHWSSKTLYPGSAPNYHATGTLVSLQRE